jgi:hypothetical protein
VTAGTSQLSRGRNDTPLVAPCIPEVRRLNHLNVGIRVAHQPRLVAPLVCVEAIANRLDLLSRLGCAVFLRSTCSVTEPRWARGTRTPRRGAAAQQLVRVPRSRQAHRFEIEQAGHRFAAGHAVYEKDGRQEVQVNVGKVRLGPDVLAKIATDARTPAEATPLPDHLRQPRWLRPGTSERAAETGYSTERDGSAQERQTTGHPSVASAARPHVGVPQRPAA